MTPAALRARGGREAETAEREAIKQEKRDKERRNTEAFRRMQEEARAGRLQKLEADGSADSLDSDSECSDDDFPETEDDKVPSGDAPATGSRGDYFKMHIVDIVDVDESDDELDAPSGGEGAAPAAESQPITIEDVTELDAKPATAKPAADAKGPEAAVDGGDDDLDELD